jgi:ParB-like chromosome segregation protein Spo0J
VGIFRTKGTPATEVARQLKCSQRWVLDRLKILKLPPEVQQMLHAGRIHIYDVPVILRHIRERHLAVANEIAASKNGRKLQDRKPEMRRRFRRRRSKKEINDMTGVMLDAGVNPLAPRVASWCAGFITDEELMSDFATNKDAEAYSNKNESQ